MTPMEMATALVVDYYNEHSENTDDFVLDEDGVYVVWFCFILGGWKALLSTQVSDGMYYEVTHNVAKGETYLDAYKKFKNVCYPNN